MAKIFLNMLKNSVPFHKVQHSFHIFFSTRNEGIGVLCLDFMLDESAKMCETRSTLSIDPSGLVLHSQWWLGEATGVAVRAGKGSRLKS